VLNALDASAYARAVSVPSPGPYCAIATASAVAHRATVASRGCDTRDSLQAWKPDVVVSQFFSTYLAMRLAGSSAQRDQPADRCRHFSVTVTTPGERRCAAARSKPSPGSCARADAVIATSRGVGDDLAAHFGVVGRRDSPNP
jgi:hypothetical protein